MKTSQNTARKIARRDFIRYATIAGGAVFVVGYTPSNGQEPIIANLSGDDSLGARLNAYIFIDSSGNITILNHRPEMGQGTFESIPMIIAEELEADIDKINIVQSPASRQLYGSQMVVGSQSIPDSFDLVRRMGASAKETLIMAAAIKWKAEPGDCFAERATVIHRPTGKKLSYGDLSEAATKLSPPQDPKLKNPASFSIIGTSPPRRDIPPKISGRAEFGLDCVVPGMLYASIERSPVFLGKLISFDDSKTRTVKGVRQVLKTQRTVWGHVREGVAVLADNYWAALQGRKLLKVNWDNGSLETWSTEMIREDYHQAATQPGETFEQKGNFGDAYAAATHRVEASYETPYQTHAAMEPMNAIVDVKPDRCDYYGSTQNPNGFRSHLARQCNMSEENVVIHYTFMGGAFGRRSLTDVPEEAADLSMKTGSPVQVVWTREDDLTQGPFRACSLNVCRGGLDRDGKIVALEHKVIAQEIQNQAGDSDKAGEQIAGGINTEYAISNYAIKGVLRKLYIPISYWRSVYHSTNCFAHESFIDELAAAAKKDPLEFRLSMLTGHERYTGVLKMVAEKSGWHQPRNADTGKGVAIVERSGSLVATVVEVAKKGKSVRPVKVTVAIDSGIAVNPDILKAQTEGCVVMGLTASYHGLTIEKGQVVEQNFNAYPMLRINECPDIEVYAMKNNYAPAGAGEAGLPGVAPALTNAIYNLTGKRIRKLPFNLDEV